MTRRTAAGWHTYEDVGELLSELELTDEDMTHARDVTDDHVRALGGSLRIVADFGDRKYRLT